MKSIFSLLCLFSMFFSFSFKAPVFSDVEELRNLGEVYLNKGEFERALPYFKKAAAQNDSEAQFFLGEIYFNGHDAVSQNYETAREWFLLAAAQNHAKAQFYLGMIYSEGYGVEANAEEAFQWYERSAQNGDMDALYNLACCYKEGFGIEQDLEKAQEIYIQLAEEDYFFAQIMLSEMQSTD